MMRGIRPDTLCVMGGSNIPRLKALDQFPSPYVFAIAQDIVAGSAEGELSPGPTHGRSLFTREQYEMTKDSIRRFGRTGRPSPRPLPQS